MKFTNTFIFCLLNFRFDDDDDDMPQSVFEQDLEMMDQLESEFTQESYSQEFVGMS